LQTHSDLLVATVPSLFFAQGSDISAPQDARAQDRTECREPLDWDQNDYAVVDEARFGRIYMERIHGKMKRHWFLRQQSR
jgi:hypothetical protein